MTRITEELVRKRAEHNEGEIFSLQELSLHQQNIEKLENLDKWCRDLKILYLHNNLIPKIENVSKLKKLEYINFTLNNIKRIENLEGCESLKKLDLTINFIGELTSVENLTENYNLRELYLTGNPCADYEGCRDFIIATLPQLTVLDGVKITKTESILALQKFKRIRTEILEQQRRYMKKHDVYLDESSAQEKESETEESENENFWKKVTKFTPESRVEVYNHMERQRTKSEKKPLREKKPRKMFTDSGRPLNANEPNLDFQLIEDDDEHQYRLELAIFRYLSTEFLDVDVQPLYVRVVVKGKVFQICLPQEVCPDKSSVVRSQATGRLHIIMPKVGDFVKIESRKQPEKSQNLQKETKNSEKQSPQFLEVTPTIISSLDKIVDKELGGQQRDKEEVTQDIASEIPPLIDIDVRNTSNF